MKKTLIIPDLHLRWQQAQKIIDTVKHDEIIFLGDFFDDFGDDPNSIGEMADWLEDSVRKPNRIHLFGNHDIHYAFADEHLQCSGYKQWKHFIIHDRYEKKDIWDKFKYYHILDDKWFLAHGGLHEHWVPKEILAFNQDRPKFLRELQAYLDAEIIKSHREGSWVLHAGGARGGALPFGGLTWCDFEREFVPVKGLNQIVGHTPQAGYTAKWLQLYNGKLSYHPIDLWYPKILEGVHRSVNVDLDVYKNTTWAVWDGEKLSFGNWIDNMKQ